MAGKVLTPTQLAKRLGCTVKTLANWRSLGKGPPYHRLIARGNPVQYALEDVLKWEQRNKL